MSARDVALAFVEAINAHQSDEMARLMTSHHVFVDSDGAVQEGRKVVRGAWEAYFDMVPDYRVEIEDVFEDGERLMIAGRAEGTFAPDHRLREESHWSVPAAWRVGVEKGRVARWQVYADTEQLRGTVFRRRSG